MADQIKPGDRVRMRSGGPLMTVHAVNGDNIDCQWFTQDAELRSATFPTYMLTIIEGAADEAGRRSRTRGSNR